MARDISSLTLAASKQAVARPVLLAKLDFASGSVRVTSAPFDIASNGETYTGVGNLGGISTVPEGAELQSYAIQLTLSGIPADLIALALADQYQGREAKLYLALLDEGHRLTGAPLLIFRGQMDTLDIELGQSATLTLTVQSRLADWERPRLRRYTHEDQSAAYPADRGFEFVQQMAERTIYWGRTV